MSSPILLTNQPTFGMFETKFYAYKGLINIEQKFWEKFRDQIPSEVFFTDPAGNTFPVGLSLKGDRAVFKRNVDTMTRFYGLRKKHSMLCKYKGGNQFYILVGNRYGVEIKYPERRNPDVIVVSSDDYESDPEEYPGWTVTLTGPAASGSNPLLIPAKYVRRVLSKNQKTLTINDVNGDKIGCKILKPKRRTNERYLGRGWYTFCRKKNFKEGEELYFYTKWDAKNLWVKKLNS